jgi:hypothetical protein
MGGVAQIPSSATPMGYPDEPPRDRKGRMNGKLTEEKGRAKTVITEGGTTAEDVESATQNKRGG